jgi:hypothetical protein
MKIQTYILVLFSLVHSVWAFDVSKLTPDKIQNLTRDGAEESIKIIGFGFDHRPYRQATGLGYRLGFDLGVELSAVSVSQKFKDTLKTVGVNKDIPAYIPLPRLNAVKGLPFGLDVSGSYVGYRQIKIWGVGGQWNFLNPKEMKIRKRYFLPPSLAIRGGYNRTQLILVQSKTVSADFVVSIPMLFLFEPYAGVGYQKTTGKIWLPTDTQFGIPISVSGEHKFHTYRYFVGLPMKLIFLRVVAHAERNFLGQQFLGLKVGLEL